MTLDQQNHALFLAEEFKRLMLPKYEAGAKEHKGNIWEKESDWLLEQAIYEALDQFVYLVTLYQKQYGILDQ